MRAPWQRVVLTSADPPVDPELAAGLEVFRLLGFGSGRGRPTTAAGLAAARRQVELAVAEAVAHAAPTTGVRSHDAVVDGLVDRDGSPLVARVHRPVGAPARLPVVCWFHGGGMTLGSPSLDDLPCRATADAVGCVVVALPYRLAPEHRHPAQVEDCLAGVLWTVADHESLGIDPSRLALVGASAGGTLAAATALLARDRGGPAVALQVLVSPMLDDRAAAGTARTGGDDLMWSHRDDRAAWRALLGEEPGGQDVPPTAAPGRVSDPSGLPPTLVQVAELELLRDEAVAYARRLRRAGVPVELQVYAGAVHAWEVVAPTAAISRRSAADRVRALRAALHGT